MRTAASECCAHACARRIRVSEAAFGPVVWDWLVAPTIKELAPELVVHYPDSDQYLREIRHLQPKARFVGVWRIRLTTTSGPDRINLWSLGKPLHASLNRIMRLFLFTSRPDYSREFR